MRIVLTGGGSGGHVAPLIPIKRSLEEKLGGDAEILYIGSGAKIEKDLISAEGIRAKYVMSGKRRRYFSFNNFLDFLKIPIGFLQSLWILLVFMPDVVFSKGGYVSVPIILAAWVYHIPIIIHESDAVPGTANKLMSKFSNNIVLAYTHAESYFDSRRTAIFGNPVRKEIIGGDASAARERFNFTESKPVILVLGGSQGARVINKAIIRILTKLLDNFQVIHQTGENNFEEVVGEARREGVKEGREGYYPIGFMDSETLKNSMALADLVISRAGANSISEIAANSKASILIPIEKSANDHQRMNAYELAKIGGTLVLEESNLGKNILLKKIEKIILKDRELHDSMAKKVSAFYHPDAASNIADGIIQLGRK